MSTQPQGRPIRELRAIVQSELRRWDILGELWGDLTETEQESLIAKACQISGRLDPRRVADAFTPPDPFSRKV